MPAQNDSNRLTVALSSATLSATSANAAPLSIVAWVQDSDGGIMLSEDQIRLKFYEPAGEGDARASLTQQGMGPDLGRHQFVVRYYALGDTLCEWDAGGYTVYEVFTDGQRFGNALASWEIV